MRCLSRRPSQRELLQPVAPVRRDQLIRDGQRIRVHGTDGYYYLFHAVRANMLSRLGRNNEAAIAYEAAITRTNNLTEREYMQRRLDGLASA